MGRINASESGFIESEYIIHAQLFLLWLWPLTFLKIIEWSFLTTFHILLPSLCNTLTFERHTLLCSLQVAFTFHLISFQPGAGPLAVYDDSPKVILGCFPDFFN